MKEIIEDKKEIDISFITPIKPNMTPEEEKKAIKEYLVTEVKPIISTHELDKNEGYAYQGLERSIGALYLQKFIQTRGIKHVKVAEPRIYIKENKDISEINIKKINVRELNGLPLINSQDVISYSQDVGNIRPTGQFLKDHPEILSELEIISQEGGYTDMGDVEQPANLRLYDDKLYIIDTEYSSFSNKEMRRNIELEDTLLVHFVDNLS